eukprot:TRINITY_DN745_c0_g1_i1.p1 TRINITY_DN745_c0_g1~~TRINITY_DN745_c0_g1_i1.p1  ORF type:complete len:516 (+),score=79.86 TRINITY_DN745_c0_g1_i1:76-1623(+)
MEKNEDTNPWSHLVPEIEDILFKEVFPKLKWDDIKNLSVCKVNKAWRALFTKNTLWKLVLQKELPFVDITNTTDHFKKFFDSLASFKKISCEHTDADVSTAIRVCPCMFPLDLTSTKQHAKHYTGYKNEFIVERDDCKCQEKIPTREYLQFPLICNQCYENLKDSVDLYNRRGTIETQRKFGNGTWIHKELDLPEEILVASPIPNSQNLIAITKNAPKKLVLLKINDNIIEQEDLIECTGDSFRISNDGKYVAVYTNKGTQGFVYNLHDRRTTFTFERGDYQVIHCAFPVAFFTYENKEYLIAGKTWNRIDLYDPETGESLKERDLTNKHLEYFWGSLYVSPDQKSLCSFGWVWHPVGICYKFSIDDWMKDNLYAMEKGTTLAEGYDWDYPLCWLDNNTVAIWGDSTINSDHHGLPVVRSYIVPTDELNDDNTKKHELYVPLDEHPFVFDSYLISLNPKGIELVDVSDSHVLSIHNQREVSYVLCYNTHTKQVVSIKKDDGNVLVLSRVQYYDKN